MTEVLNHDVVGVNDRLNRVITEVYKSASSGVTQFSDADLDRLNSYLDAVDEYHKWVIDTPELDLPESHPKTYTLDAEPAVTKVENDAVNDIIRILTVCRSGIVNSQSARKASGFIGFDSDRLFKNVDKVRKFIADYISKVQPIDNPESSPSRGRSGAGNSGI